MMKKKIAAAFLALVFSVVSAVAAFASQEGVWHSDGEGTQYQYEDGTFPKNCWLQIDGFWYHFNFKGYMATGWTRIGGYYYQFSEKGVLSQGWTYNDNDEKWYYFNDDATYQKGWMEYDGSWYYFTAAGAMVKDGYRSIDGQRYYFFEDGQMAANQYIGTFYMDENGQRNPEYDIEIEGKAKDVNLSAEEKEIMTEALRDIPRAWIKYLTERGWEFLYYNEKLYFNAPESDGSVTYIYHKLDTSYRKIKFCNPQALTAAMGELIGYASEIDKADSDFAKALAGNTGNVDQFVEVPSYYSQDLLFYFGKLVEVYLDPDVAPLFEADSPLVYQAVKAAVDGNPPELIN